jgi:hypothetical protein
LILIITNVKFEIGRTHVTFWSDEKCVNILVGNSEKKGPLWGPSCGLEVVIEINLKERKY